VKKLRGHFVIIFVIFTLLAPRRLLANITGSPHDFSGAYSNPHGRGEICQVCHTPHNAGSSQVPLWRGGLFIDYYKLYSSDTLDATVSQPRDGGSSKACLTCHDGSIAKGALTGCQYCHNWGPRDTNLSNDHPISFTYDAALAQKDGALRDPGNTPVSSLGGKTIKEVMLSQNRMECSSCHDVHATKGDSATARKLLLVNNAQDKLCFTCHIK